MAEERWAELVAGTVGGPVTVGTTFGSKGLRLGNKYFAIWWHEQLVLKLPAARAAELVGSGAAEPFEPMAGRRMTGWTVVDPGTDWPALTAQARSFLASQQR